MIIKGFYFFSILFWLVNFWTSIVQHHINMRQSYCLSLIAGSQEELASFSTMHQNCSVNISVNAQTHQLVLIFAMHLNTAASVTVFVTVWFMFRPSCFVVQRCLSFLTCHYLSHLVHSFGRSSFSREAPTILFFQPPLPTLLETQRRSQAWWERFSLQHVFGHIQGLLLAGHVKNTTSGRCLWDLNHLNWLLSLQRSNVVWVPPGLFAHISHFTLEHQKSSVVFSSDYCSF